jgi:hypothetical protein
MLKNNPNLLTKGFPAHVTFSHSFVRHLFSMRCSDLPEIRVVIVDAELVAEAGHVG